MKQRKLLKILEILDKYITDDDEMSYDDYSLFLTPDEDKVSKGDILRLMDMDVFWDIHTNCWRMMS